MNEYEDRVRHVAQNLVYPPTPTLGRSWGRRRLPVGVGLRRVAVVVALALWIVMVTPLRAALLDWLRIGTVTILTGESPTLTPMLPSLLDLFGETTLDEARQQVDFPLRLPPDVGPPDAVYYQGDSVITLWQANDDRPALALYHLGRDAYLKVLSIAHNTQVNGQSAIWMDVPHPLEYLGDGDDVVTRQTALVEGNVLIWQTEGITYRLESTLTQAQAIAFAESLR